MSSESEQTAVELADLTLDEFKTWITVNVKAFLHLRGKNYEGGQESLAAKVFSAWCDKVPVNPELEHSERCIKEEYKVKLVINKEPNEPGGYIHSVYCTCTSGILGTCNHVTGMLSRIENAVQTGLAIPSKTSVLCTWNIPKGQRVDTTVKPVRDLVSEKSVYTMPKSKSVKLANDKKEYLDFSLAVTNQEKLKDKENLRNSLFTILEKDIPSPCFVLSMKSKMTVKNSSMEPQTPPVDSPETVKQLSNTYTYNESNTLLQNVVEFTRSLNVSKNQTEHLKNLTKEQESLELWFEQRWGRMAASNFHRICSRMNTRTKKPEENPNNLLRSLLYSKPFESEETKYGKSIGSTCYSKIY